MRKIILLLDFSEDYSKSLLKGITKYTKERNSQDSWVLCRMPISLRDTIGIKGILQWAQGWGADGMIALLKHEEEANLIIQAGIPLITQDFEQRFNSVPSITSDYYDTGKLGAEYFLKKGYTHFAFYGFDKYVWSKERAEGYKETIERKSNKNGHTFNHFKPEENQLSDLWYYKPSSLSEWIKSLPKPVALMTCNDEQGQHVTEACKLASVRVPEDVAVLGVDNDEVICEISNPPLSSIRLNTKDGGYEAARKLDYLIAEKSFISPHITVKSIDVVERQSTDITAINDPEIQSVLRHIHNHKKVKLEVEDVIELKQVTSSRRKLEIKFRAFTGLGIKEYIRSYRVDEFAKELLLLGKKDNYKKLVGEWDFEMKNLARDFFKVKKCTPVDYMKNHNGTSS